jgi:hypothetical protein
MLKTKGGIREMLRNASGRGNRSALPDGPTSNSLTEKPEVSMRITFALVPTAAADLKRTQDRSGLSRTDIVNRALTLYEFIDAELSAGGDLFVCHSGQQYMVKLLSPTRRKLAA